MTDKLPSTIHGSLPALKRGAAIVAKSSAGQNFLRLLKSGEWVYGGDDTEVEEDSLWAINPNSFMSGFTCWVSGQLEGEEMRPITDDPILLSQLPDVGGKWSACVGFQLVCISGEDEGTTVDYSTTSHGGKKETNRVLQDLISKIEAEPAALDFVPVVTMDMDSYKHKEYGKIYTPIFAHSTWATMDDLNAGEVKPEAEEATPEPEPEKKAKRRTRKRAA